MRRWMVKWLLSVSILIGIAPLLSVLTSGAIAGALGCRLDEGGQYPCGLAGLDIGGALYVGAVSGWFMFLTWPLVLVGAIGWAMLLLHSIVRRLRRTKSVTKD